MAKKVERILLVSTPYDAWIMEEDCRLSERIINEYRGLNLSRPPRLTWVSDTEQALEALRIENFQMVVIMTGHIIPASYHLSSKIKKQNPDIPVILLCHEPRALQEIQEDPVRTKGFDRIFLWSGNTDLLVSVIKSVEDHMNVAHDSKCAGIRIILLVEDSPLYLSSLLPILYRKLVVQTQAVLEDVLNEEHRLLTMRARPKILIARTFEEAFEQYKTFEPYILGVISDVRFPYLGRMDDMAGVNLLKLIQKERFDVPLLLTSSEPSNRFHADNIPAVFMDKNSTTLHDEIHTFFIERLGFGEFIFKTPSGKTIAEAGNLRELEKLIAKIPEDAFANHCNNNDFSRWLFVRTEIGLARTVRPFRAKEFTSIEKRRQHLLTLTRSRLKARKAGMIVDFEENRFDADTNFYKIGNGSLGGKARGLAFVTVLLYRDKTLKKQFPGIKFFIPRSLVITTEVFEMFIEENGLKSLAKDDIPDSLIASQFLDAEFPESIAKKLKAYLTQVKYPLAVRSSGLLEDAQFMAYAGLYKTYMLPNNEEKLNHRLAQLIKAIKLIYASAFFLNAKSFAKRIGQRIEEEKMGILIQQLVGKSHKNCFYPAVSGIAQSYNYYQYGKMRAEEGIATIALGLGKTVMEGGKALRFSPYYPHILPHSSNVDDILENSQRSFYALKLNCDWNDEEIDESATLIKQNVTDVITDPVVQEIVSTYLHNEHRIRDSYVEHGSPIITFANVLKHNVFPISDILKYIMAISQEGMGCPVEIEFSANLGHGYKNGHEFAILQLRPMTAREELKPVIIDDKEVDGAFCYSTNALGNAVKKDMEDIVYVKPDSFDPAYTMQIAQEISKINKLMISGERKYLIIGPGRWGSADQWLGIPVNWSNISNVGAIVETTGCQIKADPSQGSHFFHNITTQGINYITITKNGKDFVDWKKLKCLTIVNETKFVAHVKTNQPYTLKVDGRISHAVINF